MASLLYPLLGKFLVVVYVEFGHLDDRPPRNCDDSVKRQVLYQLLFLSFDKKTKRRIEYLYAGNTPPGAAYNRNDGVVRRTGTRQDGSYNNASC